MGAKTKAATSRQEHEGYQRRPFYEVVGDSAHHWAEGLPLRQEPRVTCIDWDGDVRAQLHPEAHAVYDARKAEADWWREQGAGAGLDPNLESYLETELQDVLDEPDQAEDHVARRRQAVERALRVLRRQRDFYSHERVAELQWHAVLSETIEAVARADKLFSAAAAIRDRELNYIASRSPGPVSSEVAGHALSPVVRVRAAMEELRAALYEARDANGQRGYVDDLMRRPGAVGRPRTAARDAVIEALLMADASGQRAYTVEVASEIVDRRPREGAADPANALRKRRKRRKIRAK